MRWISVLVYEVMSVLWRTFNKFYNKGWNHISFKELKLILSLEHIWYAYHCIMCTISKPFCKYDSSKWCVEILCIMMLTHCIFWPKNKSIGSQKFISMQKVNFKIKIKSYFLTENHQEKSLIFDPQERHIVMVMDNQEDFPDWQCCNETFIKMTSISRNVTLGFFSIWKFCLAMHYRIVFLKGHLQTFWAWFANVIAKNHWGRRRHVQEKCIWRQKSDNLRSSLPCCKHETWKLLIVIFCSSKKQSR